MDHFSQEAWVDFVRGITSAENSHEIESHLAGGCEACLAARETWKKVYAIAAGESSLTAPDSAVRMVKQEFALRQPPAASPAVLARLVFDSLLQPLPVGVRSGGSDSRQLVYETDATTVDLRLDAQRQSNMISLVGQVVDKQSTKLMPRQVSVVLWTENGQPQAEAPANEFGEFQMEFAAQDRLRLSIEIAGEKTIRIPPTNLRPEAGSHVTEDSGGGY
ncbi:MAG TPA: hypothetical protein VGF08_11320 [Terriglobales bacterium]|jgi:hypothetical protein